ncbi:MAG TPA: hypothetical protein VEJ36_06250 [Nitrososphaerales archaeon]|nr:hypothetical protein [Nitrososphaerales archaeon]
MTNTIAGSTMKLLTLMPFVALVYFYDFSRFISLFTSPQQLSLFFVASSLLVLGAGLKWRILKVRLELSHASFPWGLSLLACAAGLYVYGSYSGDVAWFHYESLYVFVLGYVAFRMGTGVLRSMLPLLAIFSLSFTPTSLITSIGGVPLIALLYVAFLGFFLVYVGRRPKAMAVPVVLVLLGLLAWFRPGPIVHGIDPVLLVPIPLLALVLPGIRSITLLPREQGPVCAEHRVLRNGFCSVCGVKVHGATGPESFGAWGLLAVALVSLLLASAALPALALVDGAPQTVRYSPRGVVASPIPVTPAGWQVNSSETLSNSSQLYSIQRSYVPGYDPEVKNYTMYYELSLGQIVSNAPSGRLSGWNGPSYNSTQFGPFEGTLATYVRPGAVMLVYAGKAVMSFLNGTTVVQCNVGIGFERQFDDANATADATQFIADVGDAWGQSFETQASYSPWSSFLSGLRTDSEGLGTLTLVAISIAAMGWAVYRSVLPDEKLDKYLAKVSARSGRNWPILSSLLEKPHRSATSNELAGGVENMSSVDSTMRELADRQLVGPELVERGSDIVSAWKALA